MVILQHGICKQYGICTVWYLYSMVIVQYDTCKVWYLYSMVFVQYGTCAVWYFYSMRLVQYVGHCSWSMNSKQFYIVWISCGRKYPSLQNCPCQPHEELEQIQKMWESEMYKSFEASKVGFSIPHGIPQGASEPFVRYWASEEKDTIVFSEHIYIRCDFVYLQQGGCPCALNTLKTLKSKRSNICETLLLQVLRYGQKHTRKLDRKVYTLTSHT